MSLSDRADCFVASLEAPDERAEEELEIACRTSAASRPASVVAAWAALSPAWRDILAPAFLGRAEAPP